MTVGGEGDQDADWEVVRVRVIDDVSDMVGVTLLAAAKAGGRKPHRTRRRQLQRVERSANAVSIPRRILASFSDEKG